MQEFVYIDQPDRSQHSRAAAYLIRHHGSGRVYVGSTDDFYVRRMNHESSLRRGTHYNPGLQEAFNSDPTISFSVCFTATREEAYAIESQLIQQYGTSSFNVATDVLASARGLVRSEETREKIRQAHTGKKLSPEHVAKVAEANRGKKRLPEVGAAISARLTGVRHTAEHVENNRQAQLARNLKHTDEAKAKISATHKGKKKDPESVAKRSKAVVIGGVEYPGISQASRELGMDRSTLTRHLKHGKLS